MKFTNLILFLSGIIFYDGINHLFLAIKNSPYSVHGLYLGVSGNWILSLSEFAVVVIVFTYNRKLL